MGKPVRGIYTIAQKIKGPAHILDNGPFRQVGILVPGGLEPCLGGDAQDGIALEFGEIGKRGQLVETIGQNSRPDFGRRPVVDSFQNLPEVVERQEGTRGVEILFQTFEDDGLHRVDNGFLLLDVLNELLLQRSEVAFQIPP